MIDESNPYDGTEYVINDVHRRRAQRVLGFAQGSQQRRHAGTDLSAEDDRDAGGQGDEALGGHHHRQADGRRRGLHQRREKRADKHPEDRPFHGAHQLDEAFVSSQR